MSSRRPLIKSAIRSARRLLFLLAPFFLYTYRYCNRTDGDICFSRSPFPEYTSGTSFSVEAYNSLQGCSAPHPYPNLTTNIVVATTSRDNINWLNKIQIPQLTITRYVANDQKAQYHPPKNKGKEATIYFTYLYQHYYDLHDITIFMHAEDKAWHSETLLEDSMACTLNQLDTLAIHKRGYVNLRVGWGPGCPDWISTIPDESDMQRAPESASMWQAFSENFPLDAEGNAVPVPQILAQPCCSQIALSRAKIQSLPRDAYAYHQDWLLNTQMPDRISGRTWEHMFQYLFTNKAVDCPTEWRTYCAMYRMCFEGPEQIAEFHALKQEKKELLKTKLRFWTEFSRPGEGESARKRVGEIDARMDYLRLFARGRGRDDGIRDKIVGDMNLDLYAE